MLQGLSWGRGILLQFYGIQVNPVFDFYFWAAILPHTDGIEELLESSETAEEPQAPLGTLKPEDVLLGMYLLL